MKIFLILSALSLFSINQFSCKKDVPDIEYEFRLIEGDYYVAPDGSDDNPGTKEEPWLTIQKAVNDAEPGSVVVVKEGYYDEYVKIKNNGLTKDNPTVFFSESLYGARCRGFYVNADYIDIDGFGVEAMGETNWTGVILDQCAYVTIQNCSINECPVSGIRMRTLCLYISILNNKLDHNGNTGISIIGNNCLAEGNEISRTVQYHPKGLEPGFTGADADGFRVFGTGNIIRGNKVINIGDPDDEGNIDPHVDCIQSWDGGLGGLPVMNNTLIEKNFFSTHHPSGKGILVDAVKGNTCRDLIIRNNVFEFRDTGLGFYNGSFANIFVYNNVFKAMVDDKSWGTAVAFSDIDNYAYINNISADCHPEHRKITGGYGTVDYNLSWNSDGEYARLTPELQAHELTGVDPKFVSYSSEYGVNDYHLSSGSPAIDKGATLKDVTDDFDSIPRPQGAAYDMGAFEYKPQK